MRRILIVPALAGLALSACNRPAEPAADTNMAAVEANAAADANTVATTGSPSSIGAYGPGLVTTANFVKHAALSDMFEIAAAKIALKRSASPPIKDFAQQMIDAHTETTAKLKAAIAAGKVTDAPPAALDEVHAKQLAKLDAEKADAFDRSYLDGQTQAHREALGLLDSYALHGDNASLKQFATEVKPHVQEHLALAEKLDHSGADEGKGK